MQAVVQKQGDTGPPDKPLLYRVVTDIDRQTAERPRQRDRRSAAV